MKWHEIKTPRAYSADEVISALQKEIRRGHALEAAYWANELYNTIPPEDKNSVEKCWQRLLVTSVEDIGPALPQATMISFATWKDYYEGFLMKEFEYRSAQQPNELELHLFCEQDGERDLFKHPILRFSIFNEENIRCIKKMIEGYSEKLFPYSIGNLAVCGLSYLLAKFPKDRIVDELYNIAKLQLNKYGEKHPSRHLFENRGARYYLEQLLFAEDENSEKLYAEARIWEDILYFMTNYEEEFWPTVDFILERHPIDEFCLGEIKLGWKMEYQPFFYTLQETYFMMPKGRGDRYMRGLFAIYGILNPEIFVRQEVNIDIPFEEICNFISDEKLDIPDYALDKHTKRGREMGRSDLHFWTEGCKIENHSPYRNDEVYKAILHQLETSRK